MMNLGLKCRAVALCASLCACAAAGERQRAASYPPSSTRLCSYVGLEADSAPLHDNLDSVWLIAVYRLNEPGARSAQPIELKFQVERARVNELRAQLETNRQVICRPDYGAHYRVEAGSFGRFAPVPDERSLRAKLEAAQ